jgi:hypothetical protein
MADLHNLLDELDDHQYEDDIVKGRPSIAATEATEAESDWGSPDRGATEVPLVLKDASRRYEEGEEDVFIQANLLDDELNTENELYFQLHRRWLQERHCPELMEYDENMVQDLKNQLEKRQDWIDQSEGSKNAVDNLMATMAQMDMDRVKFVLSDWLSQRLTKIEEHPLYMREKVDHMSDAEVAYLKQYGALYEHHLRNTVLDQIPEAWQRLDDESMIDTPDYESYHFWHVKEGMEYEEGTCLVAKYQDMRESMKEGKVELQL